MAAQDNVTVRIGAVLAPGFAKSFTQASTAVDGLKKCVNQLNTAFGTTEKTVGTLNTALSKVGGKGASAAIDKLIGHNQRLIQSYKDVAKAHATMLKQAGTVPAMRTAPVAAAVRQRTQAVSAAMTDPTALVIPSEVSSRVASAIRRGKPPKVYPASMGVKGTPLTATIPIPPPVGSPTGGGPAGWMSRTQAMGVPAMGGAIPPPKTPKKVATGGGGASEEEEAAVSATGRQMGMTMAAYGLTHAGYSAMAAGGYITHAIKGTVHESAEYVHQLALMEQLNMSNYEIIQATQQAWKVTAQIPTATAAEVLATTREVRTVFGNTQDAIKHVGTVMKVQSLLGNLMPGGAEAAKSEAYTLARALELKGGRAIQTPAGFEDMAQGISKALIALGGKITASDFLSAFKYGRAATAGWDKAFVTTILPTLIQEMKSAGGGMAGVGGPGAALRAAYDAVVGGQMTKTSAQQFAALGLIAPGGMKLTKKGEVAGVTAGGVVGYEEFITNPYAWTQKYFVPALQKATHGDEAKMRSIIQSSFSNALARFAFTQMSLPSQRFKFERDIKLYQQAGGFETLPMMLKRDPHMAFNMLKAQWTNLMAILGKSVFMETINRVVIGLAEALNKVATFIQQHGDDPLFKMIAVGAGLATIAIGGLLSVGGALLAFLGSLAFAMEGLVVLKGLLALPIGKGGIIATLLEGGAGGALGKGAGKSLVKAEGTQMLENAVGAAGGASAPGLFKKIRGVVGRLFGRTATGVEAGEAAAEAAPEVAALATAAAEGSPIITTLGAALAGLVPEVLIIGAVVAAAGVGIWKAWNPINDTLKGISDGFAKIQGKKIEPPVNPIVDDARKVLKESTDPMERLKAEATIAEAEKKAHAAEYRTSFGQGLAKYISDDWTQSKKEMQQAAKDIGGFFDRPFFRWAFGIDELQNALNSAEMKKALKWTEEKGLPLVTSKTHDMLEMFREPGWGLTPELKEFTENLKPQHWMPAQQEWQRSALFPDLKALPADMKHVFATPSEDTGVYGLRPGAKGYDKTPGYQPSGLPFETKIPLELSPMKPAEGQWLGQNIADTFSLDSAPAIGRGYFDQQEALKTLSSPQKFGEQSISIKITMEGAATGQLESKVDTNAFSGGKYDMRMTGRLNLPALIDSYSSDHVP